MQALTLVGSTSADEKYIPINFDALKSLNADLGIDMSFLDSLEKDLQASNTSSGGVGNKCENNAAQAKLDENTTKELQDKIQKNAELIQELKVKLYVSRQFSGFPPIPILGIAHINTIHIFCV